MKADTIKLLGNYAIFLVVIIGGLYFLYQTAGESGESIQTLRVLIAGFIGGTLTHIQGSESSIATSRQIGRAAAAASTIALTPPPITTPPASDESQGVTP